MSCCSGKSLKGLSDRLDLGQRIGFFLAFHFHHGSRGGVDEAFVGQFFTDTRQETFGVLKFLFQFFPFRFPVDAIAQRDEVFLGAYQERNGSGGFSSAWLIAVTPASFSTRVSMISGLLSCVSTCSGSLGEMPFSWRTARTDAISSAV